MSGFDNRLDNAGVPGMTDAQTLREAAQAQLNQQQQQYQGLYDRQRFLAGYEPPSAAPREKDLLGQAVRLAEFLKPMDPQTRHAVWDLAQSALNAVSRTEERERRARAQKDTEEREQLKRNTRGNRAMRNEEDTDLDEDEDEDD